MYDRTNIAVKQYKMYKDKFTIACLFVLILAKQTFTKEIFDPPLQNCQPHPVLTQTGNSQMLVIPAYVLVFRCRGGQRPQQYQCQPTASEVLKFHTFKFGGEAYAVEVENHTSCKEVCVCGRCLGGKEEARCETPKIWNPATCRCEDPFTCSPSVYNVKKKIPDSQNDSKGLSYPTVFLLLVAEMVLMVICAISWKKWREHRRKKNSVLKISPTISGNLDSNLISYKSMAS